VRLQSAPVLSMCCCQTAERQCALSQETGAHQTEVRPVRMRPIPTQADTWFRVSRGAVWG
jgi:hypothetical protein